MLQRIASPQPSRHLTTGACVYTRIRAPARARFSRPHPLSSHAIPRASWKLAVHPRRHHPLSVPNAPTPAAPTPKPAIPPFRRAMLFAPDELPSETPPFFVDASAGGDDWRPLWRHACSFGPALFAQKMHNLIRNPNFNSTWLFRADILYDDGADADAAAAAAALARPRPPTTPVNPLPRDIDGFVRHRTLVRRMIPRNERRDRPLDQTCSFYASYSSSPSDPQVSLVLYLPHLASAADLPYYHPNVRGIAHLHEWHPLRQRGFISVHLLPFRPADLADAKLRRTAFHLLRVLHKHGENAAGGYVKRVHHDRLIPQLRFQRRYALLKDRHARRLVDTWAESTDPAKHVFEDLGIAAFLIELWLDMYAHAPFPGFVDIGCGNGLLVHILTLEGYPGWGFDARARKSWPQYQQADEHDGHDPPPPRPSLQQRLLLPGLARESQVASFPAERTHDGLFPRGTFIVSNHADELTPWTPILAALSRCPFVMIPCCSHKLTGDKFRAPPPRDKAKPKTIYASFVDWVTRIAEDCGWEVETEMLRIPSTRNTCLLGHRRRRKSPADADADADLNVHVDLDAILRDYGGVQGFHANIAKLLNSGPRSH